MLLGAGRERVKVFINLMWYHVFLAMEHHLIENPDEIVLKESPSTTVLCTPILLFTNRLFTVRCYASPVK